MVLPASHGVPRAPRYSGYPQSALEFHIRASHPLWGTFPGPSATPLHPMSGPYNPWARRPRFGLIRVRSPLLTESQLISFPPGTEMFQFPGFASDRSRMTSYYRGRVSPFGHLRIKTYLAAPRRFSQLIASFIASWRQGIHHLPFLA